MYFSCQKLLLLLLFMIRAWLLFTAWEPLMATIRGDK